MCACVYTSLFGEYFNQVCLNTLSLGRLHISPEILSSWASYLLWITDDLFICATVNSYRHTPVILSGALSETLLVELPEQYLMLAIIHDWTRLDLTPLITMSIVIRSNGTLFYHNITRFEELPASAILKLRSFSMTKIRNCY